MAIFAPFERNVNPIGFRRRRAEIAKGVHVDIPDSENAAPVGWLPRRVEAALPNVSGSRTIAWRLGVWFGDIKRRLPQTQHLRQAVAVIHVFRG